MVGESSCQLNQTCNQQSYNSINEMEKAVCNPQCRWECDQPQCEQICKPVCQEPKCSVDCNELEVPKCNISCKKTQL